MNGAGVILIAGPTASGKSAAALALAEKIGGEIVNADAMQVYRDLRILTARPSPAEEAAVRHHLYGVLDGAERCSAGRWARLAGEAVRDILARGRPAIIAGGTGLYFRALEDGLSPIPEIPPAAREQACDRLKELGAEAFRAEVVERDPAMARLPEGDAQRLLRAWEVFEATGERLSHFRRCREFRSSKASQRGSLSNLRATFCMRAATPAPRRCWRRARLRKSVC
jgi:tRNA dimethylallyltransferase